ncbi:MAG TPA: hypothetical protein PLU30_18250 [Verrucomicrobiae bacterium]|nr:hypothetical protein [Verrucomicrobiae bacterium]
MSGTRAQRWAVGFAVLSLNSGIWAAAGTVELIADAGFHWGLRAKDRDGQERVIRWGESTNAPVWKTAQHFSKSCIVDVAHQAFRPRGFTFKDDYALLAFHPGDEGADLVAGLNALREYGGVYRAKGDPWPHLYLSQGVASPGGHLGDRCPSIADMARLDFSIGVRLLYDHRNIGAGYDRTRHAAQFVIFLTIQNLARKSAGYGDYYSFGILLYDDRVPVTSLHAMHDGGSPKKPATEKLIYDVGVRPFTDKVVASGQWVDVVGDLLPHIIAGLGEAWKRGYLPASTNLADYRVGSVIMGWEIPGLNDAAVAVKDLRATAVLRDGR